MTTDNDPRWPRINGHTVRITCKDGFADVIVYDAERLAKKLNPMIDDFRHLTWWTSKPLSELMLAIAHTPPGAAEET